MEEKCLFQAKFASQVDMQACPLGLLLHGNKCRFMQIAKYLFTVP